jgi:hypothetical protein
MDAPDKVCKNCRSACPVSRMMDLKTGLFNLDKTLFDNGFNLKSGKEMPEEKHKRHIEISSAKL